MSAARSSRYLEKSHVSLSNIAQPPVAKSGRAMAANRVARRVKWMSRPITAECAALEER